MHLKLIRPNKTNFISVIILLKVEQLPEVNLRYFHFLCVEKMCFFTRFSKMHFRKLILKYALYFV